MKRLFIACCNVLMSIILLLVMYGCSSHSSDKKSPSGGNASVSASVQSLKKPYLSDSSFEPHTESAINDFISAFGKHSILNKNAYVVTNLDDTLVINDITRQCQAFQADTMAYAFTPDTIREVLSKNIDPDIHDFNLWFDDIENAYRELWDTFGPFDAKGLDDETQEELHEDAQWIEFAVKMRGLLDHIEDKLGSRAARDWMLHLAYDMTPQETYDLFKRACEKYQNRDTEVVSVTSPEEIDSQLGVREVSIKYGASIPSDMKKMIDLFADNNIDIWICADSHIEGVHAAIDSFGLHDYIAGFMGLTPQIKDGRYALDYDYENGFAYKKDGNTFNKYTSHLPRSYCYGKGKTESISNVLIPLYGIGPLAGMMTSTADFNFCTEFSSLQMVMCFNMGRGTVTEAGPIMGIISLYQEEAYNYNLARAMKAKDTLYLFQGRDETGKRELIPSHASLNCDRELLVVNDDPGYAALSLSVFALRNNIKDTLYNCAIFHKVDDPRNTLGYDYGFLDRYEGYHSK